MTLKICSLTGFAYKHINGKRFRIRRSAPSRPAYRVRAVTSGSFTIERYYPQQRSWSNVEGRNGMCFERADALFRQSLEEGSRAWLYVAIEDLSHDESLRHSATQPAIGEIVEPADSVPDLA